MSKWTFERLDGCPVVGICQSKPYQDCGRNITNNVRWLCEKYH